ncbi:MAG TPA: ABC transporter permease [Pseudonocardiaceae bacterium]|jgi:ABC-2 type transport system permease protein
MRSYATAVGNEIYKGLRFAWAERLQILIELPMFVIIMLFMGPIMGQAQQIVSGSLKWSLNSESTSILVAWFIPFMFFYLQVVKMFWRLVAERQAGTLEQVYLSPLPSWLVIAAGRVVAAVVETLIVAAGMFAIVRIIVPLHFHLMVSVLLPVLLMIVTAVGVSLLVAGATLIWGRIEMITESVLLLMFVGSVGAVPLVSLPDWWKTFGRILPVNTSLESLLGVLFQGRSATTLWGPGGLVWVLIVAAAYLAAGIFAVSLGGKIAKRRGTLSRY